MIIDIVKVILPSILAFVCGIAITPILTSYLYRNKMWKKKAGKVDFSGNETVLFNAMHKEREVNTPRMGGIVIWLSAAITISLFWLLGEIFSNEAVQKIDFLSRNQTWIPLFVLLLGGLIGLVDDYMEVKGSDGVVLSPEIAAMPAKKKNTGMSLKKRLLIVGTIGLITSLWFYFKLDVSSIGLPGGHILEIGLLFIPLFVLVTLGIYSGGVIDGIDGLAGGIFASIFAAYAGLAFYQQQIDLAAFCALLAGSILAFLWFNIPPARYYMSETGTMGLTMALTVVAFMTDSLGEGYGLILLPIIALPLVITALSSAIQVFSKKMRNGKKVFLIAPLHHHFEAKGWPPYKVTMRFWVFGVLCAVTGLILGLIG